MDPVNLAIGFGTGLLPTILDEITGASRERKRAMENQDREYQMLMNELESEAGKNATDSILFKTGITQLNKRDKNVRNANKQNAVASGATPEAELGADQGANESYNDATINLLNASDAERKRLKALKRRLQLERVGLQVDEANLNSQNFSQLATGLTSAVPYLFQGDTSPSTTSTAVPGQGKNYKKRPMNLLGSYQPVGVN